MTLELLPGTFAICRLGPTEEAPPWARQGPFSSVTRTAAELSIVCPEAAVPAGVRFEGSWVGLRVLGPLDLGGVGVLASLAGPLARAGIPIFVISTYDTDHLLVRQGHLESAVEALSAAGHEFAQGRPDG